MRHIWNVLVLKMRNPQRSRTAVMLDNVRPIHECENRLFFTRLPAFSGCVLEILTDLIDGREPSCLIELVHYD